MSAAAIVGTGSHVPERVVGNEEVAARLGVEAGWIEDFSGVRERRYAPDSEQPADLSVRAAGRAVEAAHTSIDEVDYMISAIENSDFHFPGSCCFVQEKLALGTDIGALDVRGHAAGFLYGLSVADAFIRAEKYSNVLLMGTELYSCGLEWDEKGREITPLLADGSGAVVLGPGEPGQGVLASDLHCDGRHAREYWISCETNTSHPRATPQMLAEGRQFARIDSRLFARCAVEGLVESIPCSLAAAGVSTDEVAMFLLQQGNRRVNEAVAAKLGLPAERVDWSIEHYGNTGAASIPISLDEAVRSGRLQSGDVVVMAAFGAGFMWGSAVVRL